MVLKSTNFNLILIYWWIVFCIIGIGIPTVLCGRYLPTRRSDPSMDGLDRLREVLREVSYLLNLNKMEIDCYR